MLHESGTPRFLQAWMGTAASRAMRRGPKGLPKISIVVPFFWFNQIDIKDPIT